MPAYATLLVIFLLTFTHNTFANAIDQTQAITNRLPVEAFSRLPFYSEPKLSPRGNKIAFFQNVKGSNNTVLAAFDMTDGQTKVLMVTDNKKYQFYDYRWANNNTIIFSVKYPFVRNGADTIETRLLAVETDVNKAEARLLIKPRRFDKRTPQFQDNIVDMLPDDPEHILISIDLDILGQPNVYRLNIYNKKKTLVKRGGKLIRHWMTDQQHRLRLGSALNYDSGKRVIYVRDDENSEWKTLFEYNALEDSESTVTPLGFGLDPNILYYKKYHQDKLAVYKIDLANNLHTEVYADPDYDVDGHLIYSHKTNDVIGITHLHADNGAVIWNQARERLQIVINKGLPKTNNYLISFSEDENRYLVYAENDASPGKFYLGDQQSKKLNFLFKQYPELPDNALAKHQLIQYLARDGVEIEGYLTLPQYGQKPYPLVMHPHGGPGSRDTNGFDYWTALMANRGYAVFRPNFRGSEGYGFDFARQQMQSWGLAMQDDITDATHWLIKQGIADPEKMCIVGASYGGYAAMMAAVKTPKLFKCAVSFAGVSDLDELIFQERYYLNKKFVKAQIGTQRKDRTQRSPITFVEKVQIPMLLAHGTQDRVVNVEQSREMADALKDSKKEVDYLELKNGNHHLSIQSNRHTFFKAMDQFLSQHLH